jgi:hypothetical protein
MGGLKLWAMRVAKLRGLRRAKVAVARKLAVVLHRMWIDGSEFRWSKASAAVAAWSGKEERCSGGRCSHPTTRSRRRDAGSSEAVHLVVGQNNTLQPRATRLARSVYLIAWSGGIAVDHGAACAFPLVCHGPVEQTVHDYHPELIGLQRQGDGGIGVAGGLEDRELDLGERDRLALAVGRRREGRARMAQR